MALLMAPSSYSIEAALTLDIDRALAMPADPSRALPRVLADLPLSSLLTGMLRDHVELLPWQAASEPGAERIEAIYTYGHPLVDEALLERLPSVRVISNFGVGVDHI